MNGTFVFIIIIVAIVMGAQTLQKIITARTAKKDENPELEEALAQIDKLEERIRVLERIVTENKYDLRHEINKL
jgi:phage shock protein B